MTPLPKRRWSSHRQGRKRATLKARSVVREKCPNCGQHKPTHTICPSCGFYKGKQLLRVKQKRAKGGSKT